MAFGEILRSWRKTRGLSQMTLALDAGISSKHVSFLETDRSKPTEGMVLRLAECLHLPLREKNAFLTAAGFARRFGESTWQDAHMQDYRMALELILKSHDPYPAVSLNQQMQIVTANEGFMRLMSKLPPIMTDSQPVSFVDATLSPGPFRDAIINWQDVAVHLVRRLRSHYWISGKNPDLEALLDKALAYPGVQEALDLSFEGSSNDTLFKTALRLNDGTSTQWISTITTFGTTQDILLEEIWIEQFHPADDNARSSMRND